jgi:hypothetical protein
MTEADHAHPLQMHIGDIFIPPQECLHAVRPRREGGIYDSAGSKRVIGANDQEGSQGEDNDETEQ